MSKDLKSELDAIIKGEQLSEEELDNVAGGTHAQNIQLFSWISKIDMSEIEFIHKTVDSDSPDAEWAFSTAVQGATNRILKKNGIDAEVIASESGDNMYLYKGSFVTHKKFVDVLKQCIPS